MRSAPFLGVDFGARVRRFWAGFWCAVCGAPILGSILVRGVWCADFRADFGARCAFLGSQDWRGPGGNQARDLSNMGPWSWRMLPFRVDFGVRGAPFLGWILVRRCAVFGLDFGARYVVRGFSGPISVHGASFLGSILVRGAPFLGSILVRGCVVRRFWGRFRCTVCLFGVVFGVWRAVFGPDFGARCVVRPILGRISLHGAPFLGSILARCPFWVIWDDFGGGGDVGVESQQLGTIWCVSALMLGSINSQRANKI